MRRNGDMAVILLCYQDQLILDQHVQKWKQRLRENWEDVSQYEEALDSATRELRLLLALCRAQDESERIRLKHLLFDELKPHIRSLAESFAMNYRTPCKFMLGTQVGSRTIRDRQAFDEVTDDLMSRAYEHFDRVWHKYDANYQSAGSKREYVMVRTWFKKVIKNKFIDIVKQKTPRIRLEKRNAPDRNRGQRRDCGDWCSKSEQAEIQVALHEHYNRLDNEEKEWQLERVDRALADLEAEGHLQPLEIQAFRYHALENQTLETTAALVARSVGWVHRRKQRIETTLKQLLGHRAHCQQDGGTLAA